MSACHRRVRWLKLLLIPSAMLLLASVSGSASAAPEQTPEPTQQPGQADPLVVVDNFLAARNGRDAMGATAFSARLLAIHDVQGEWIRDEPAVRVWLQQLIDTYLIDTLARPRANGERVVWVERLTRRGLPYREALASSAEVTVEVVVHGGRITSYSALYPVVASHFTGAGTGSTPSGPAPGGPEIPVMTLFVAWVVLAAAALILINVAPAVWHARHPTRKDVPVKHPPDQIGKTRWQPPSRSARGTVFGAVTLSRRSACRVHRSCASSSIRTRRSPAKTACT